MKKPRLNHRWLSCLLQPWQVAIAYRRDRDVERRGQPHAKWRAQSANMRAALSEELQHLRPWSPTAHLVGLAGTERQKELLDLAYLWTQEGLMIKNYASSQQHVIRDLLCDVSQNITRKPWGQGTLRTFTTSTQMYSFELDRLVLPLEGMRLLGFPGAASLAHGVSSADLSDFVGEGMALPSICLAQMSLLKAAFQLNALPDLFSIEPRDSAGLPIQGNPSHDDESLDTSWAGSSCVQN